MPSGSYKHRSASVRWLFFFAGLALLLAGCTYMNLGPDAINRDRRDYNEVLNHTENTQLLQNIVRVKNRESPQFMDVQQISAESIFDIGTGSVTMNSTGRFFGPVKPSLGYTAQPTVTYLPLSGAALVSQLATPFSVDNIAAMFNSDWPIGTVLDMTGDRLTPHFDDDYAAIDTIMELEHYSAIMITGGNSQSLLGDPGGKPPVTTISIGMNVSAFSGASIPPATTDDTLLIFLKPHGIRPDGRRAHRMVGILWSRLRKIFPPHRTGQGAAKLGRDVIAICTVPHEGSCKLRSPDMTFHSAYGVLSAASRQPFVAFVTRSEYRRIRGKRWNKDCAWYLHHSQGTEGDFYIVRKKDTEPLLRRKGTGECRGKKGENKKAAPRKPTLSGWLRAITACNADRHWKCEAARKLRNMLNQRGLNPKMPQGKFCKIGKIGEARCAPHRLANHGPLPQGPRKEMAAHHSTYLKPQLRSHPRRSSGSNTDTGCSTTSCRARHWAAKAGAGRKLPHPRFNTIDPSGVIPPGDQKQLDAMEHMLGHDRRYILIIYKRGSRPSDAYVTFHDCWDDKWYYISNHDQISKDNFLLLSQLIIMQSQSPSSPPPSPTISVGGG